MSPNAFEALAEPIQSALKDLGFSEPTLPQTLAVPPLLKGENVLLIAPTGSGKTEAVLLPVFSEFLQKEHSPSLESERGISIVYLTPMRALNRDMLRRLLFWASKLSITIEVRHGDTETKSRRRQALKPPDMLVTTPETLQAILPGSRMKRHLANVKYVVVDEVHEIASSKRGVQLAVALERLSEITETDFQRIGLSATIADPERVAKLVAGTHRDVKVVLATSKKGYKFQIETPHPEETDYELAGELRVSPEGAARIRRIVDLVDSHDSTLVFVNSRQNAEMLGHKFTQLKRDDIAVHHGSLSKEERERVEGEFKSGQLKAMICTSTMELGVDIGRVDLVIQYFSPRQVCSLVQRVGRSGHSLDRVSEGVIITAFPDDTLESLAAVTSARKGQLEPLWLHENALDVLAHQVAGVLLDTESIEVKALLKMLRSAYPYRKLTEEELLDVVDYLSWLNELKTEDEGNTLRRNRKTRRYYYENLSMIPDERRYPIIDIISNRKIGTLGDEFMALRVRVGLNFICRGRVWRVVQMDDQSGTVLVVPSEDPLAAIPGWDGEMLLIPFELAQETGKLRTRIAAQLKTNVEPKTVATKLAEKLDIDRSALVRVVEETQEQLKQGAPVPAHDHILLEVFKKYLIVHACFGETVNRTLGAVFDAILSDRELITGWWNDGYRILIEAPRRLGKAETEELPKILFDLSPETVEEHFKSYLEARFPFAYKMKFVAERFGALKRGKAMLDFRRMKQLVDQFRETPIFDETMREVMLERVDLQRVQEIMDGVKLGKLRVSTLFRQENPTPLAYHMLAKYSDISEFLAPERVLLRNIDRMKRSIEARKVDLLCLSCKSSSSEKISRLEDQPACKKCGKKLVALIRRDQKAETLREIFERRLANEKITDEELKELSHARRSADLIMSHGKRAITALEVRGVGPETAFRILGKMHQKDDDFYMDLLKAKINYVKTRQYWDDNKDERRRKTRGAS